MMHMCLYICLYLQVSYQQITRQHNYSGVSNKNWYGQSGKEATKPTGPVTTWGLMTLRCTFCTLKMNHAGVYRPRCVRTFVCLSEISYLFREPYVNVNVRTHQHFTQNWCTAETEFTECLTDLQCMCLCWCSCLLLHMYAHVNIRVALVQKCVRAKAACMRWQDCAILHVHVAVSVCAGRHNWGWGWHISQPVLQQGLRQGQDRVCQNTPADTCSTAPKGRRYQTGERRQELIDKGAQRKGSEGERTGGTWGRRAWWYQEGRDTTDVRGKER